MATLAFSDPSCPTHADKRGDQPAAQGRRASLRDRYRATRDLSTALAGPLSDADATVQSMPDASPAKWHLAHTSWFFETFVLRDHVADHQPFDPRYAFLFNSYYEAEGPRHARPMRGLITRPTLAEVLAWRDAVDAAMDSAIDTLSPEAMALVELGIQHEQQHQELLQTDLLHLMAQNPIGPALWPAPPVAAGDAAPLRFVAGQTGIVRIGHEGDGFAYDCEGPAHAVLLHPHAIATRAVTAGEWCAFIADGGYATSRLWLADGWDWLRREAIGAPLYWRPVAGAEPDDRGDPAAWEMFTLAGWRPVDAAAPVSHVSFFEADAFAAWAGAQWSGARLPREEEWEAMAVAVDADPAAGNQLDAAGPALARPQHGEFGEVTGLFGDVWEWTGSAYRPYPGFVAAPGAVGEYNGKFMAGQFVLKGASCATPRGHGRASYRNFFHPHQRWQFSGLRLARDL